MLCIDADSQNVRSARSLATPGPPSSAIKKVFGRALAPWNVMVEELQRLLGVFYRETPDGAHGPPVT